MGQGAVRSQMDTRICFRVRERKDVDLVLGQGMLSAGWHAHTLNAPGKFLVSAPEHTTPKRARAYLVTDDDVARTVARYAWDRPQLDSISRGALTTTRSRRTRPVVPGQRPARRWRARRRPARLRPPRRRRALAHPLRRPRRGGGHRRTHAASGMTRPTLYRHLAAHADAGRAIQVSRGRWRAASTEDGQTMNVGLTNLSRLTPRACLHVKARTQTMRQTTRQVIHSFSSPCSRKASNV